MPQREEERGDPGKSRQEALQRLDLLYRAYAPSLTRRMRRRVGCSEEASDLVHEAFARLLRLEALQALRKPEAFLSRVLRNLLIDRSRRLAGKALHVPVSEAEEIPVRPEQADGIEIEQMRERYRQVVASMPPRTREVFLLHRLEELSYKEIAAQLGISVRTVEWHVAEAITRISKGLDAR
jgi:RNA polymerase sigma-70 factor (ECF subfamily)